MYEIKEIPVSNWSLQAQLVWDKRKELDGTYLLTNHASQDVDKNINDGTRPFKYPDDLISCPTTTLVRNYIYS